MKYKKLWGKSPEENYYHLLNRINKRFPFKKNKMIHSPIWCLSTGRVGTNTIAELGNLSKNIVAFHEPLPLIYNLSRISYEYDQKKQNNPAITEGFLSARNMPLEKSSLYNKVYMETSPQLTFLAYHIKKLFPESRFIHVIRNPVDVIRSGMRRKWYEGNTNDQWRITPQSTHLKEQWQKINSFQKNIWLWNETNTWINNFMQEVDKEKKLVLKSEDLFSGDKIVLQEFFQFIGSLPKNKKTIKSILGKNLNSQKSGDFPLIENWDAEMKENLIEGCGNLAQSFEYKLFK